MNIPALPAPAAALPVAAAVESSAGPPSSETLAGAFADLLSEAEFGEAASNPPGATQNALPASSQAPALQVEAVMTEEAQADTPEGAVDTAAGAYAFVAAIAVEAPIRAEAEAVSSGEQQLGATAKPAGPLGRERTELAAASPLDPFLSKQTDPDAPATVFSVETEIQPISSDAAAPEHHVSGPSPDTPAGVSTNLQAGVTGEHIAAPVSIPVTVLGATSTQPPAVDVADQVTPSSASPQLPGVELRHSPATADVASSQAPVILEARITRSAGAETNAASDRSSTDTQPSEISIPPSEPRPAKTTSSANLEQSFRDTSERREDTGGSETPKPQSQSNGPDLSPRFAAESAAVDRTAATRTASTEQVRQPYVVAEPEVTPNTERTPLKQMDLRIPDENGGVTLRVQERAGSVHVSVRSSDAQLASNIADGLPDLTRTLDRQGFRAEAWTPSDAVRAGRDLEASVRTAVDIARDIQAPETTQMDETRSDPERDENRQQKQDWQEETNKRPKRQQEENFEEYLW